ncbi:Siderophore exporter MmpL4 [Phycisphaerales bacterium]|nr:Siderophore exporter MmpL4 [Phycisphaerales bacterium]
MNPADRAAGLIAFTLRHPRLTLLGAVLATSLGVLGLMSARVDATLAGMLGGSNPAANSLARIADHFHTAEDLLVLVSAPDGAALAEAQSAITAFAERFASRAASDPIAQTLIESVRFKPNLAFEAYFREVVFTHGSAYLDDDALEAFLHRLEPAEVRAQMQQNEAMLAAPGPGAGSLARELVKDPLRLRDFVRGRIVDAGPSQPSGWFSDDGGALLIRVAGLRPVNDLEFSKALSSCARRLADEAQPGDLRVELGGGYAVAATSASAIRADAISSTLSSIALLLVFFVLAYRNPFTAILLVLTAGIGIITAFGFYAFCIGTLTPLTAVLAAMLAGLGVDYAIHFHTHHHALTACGASSSDASVRTARELVVPTLAVFITTVFGFGVVALGEVRMLRDFAILGCLGLAGSVGSVYLVLPSLLRYLHPSPKPSPSHRAVAWCARAIARRPNAVIFGSLLLPAFSLVMIAITPGLVPALEVDPSVMHPQPNPPLETGKHVRERFSGVGESLLVHVRASSGASLIELCHDVRNALRSPESRHAGVRSTRGLADLLPNPRHAAARIDALSRIDAPPMLASIRREMELGEFQPGAFDTYLDFLNSLLTVKAFPGFQDLRRYPEVAAAFLPRDALDNPAADPREALVIVTLSPPASERPARHAAIEGVRSLLRGVPGATLTGVTVVSADLEHATRRDLARFSAVSLVLVLAWLVGLFRRSGDVLLALAPVLFSMLFIFGVMSMFGLRFNTVNTIAMPLLAGIAVDSGIFLVSTARRAARNGEDLVRALIPTMHATLCTSITTALGFGTLVWTRTPAVRSLGVACLLGMFASVLCAVAFVTPMLLRRSRERKAAP